MNLGENNNFFRESFRGFNKDDVAEYIAKLSNDYAINEGKYKEHIAKLTMELKAKTDECNNYLFEQDDSRSAINLETFEQKYKDEIFKLVSELEEKDLKITALQSQLQLQAQEQPENPDISAPVSEEIEKYQNTINILSKEIEKLREKSEKAALEQSEHSAEAVNQLSFQLAESESEKLYLLNLLKKFIYTLDIGCASGKNIEYAANISDIAPKAVVAEEISAELVGLIKLKEKNELLETENAELKAEVEKKQAVVSNEQHMYETITANLGEVIYSAKKSAEDITAKARSEADELVGNAKREASDIINRANETRESILVKNRENMAEFRERYAFIKSEHEEMIKKYKEISEVYTLRLSEVESAVNIIYDTITDEDFNG